MDGDISYSFSTSSTPSSPFSSFSSSTPSFFSSSTPSSSFSTSSTPSSSFSTSSTPSSPFSSFSSSTPSSFSSSFSSSSIPSSSSSFSTPSSSPASSFSTPYPSFSGLDLLLDLKPLFIPLYSTVVLVACSGNLLLLLLIGFDRKRRSTTNFLIANLALVDLVMCLFCVPLTASYAFDRRGWAFGSAMCHFVTAMQPVTVFAAVLSLTAIAVDRYVVVAYPIRRRAGSRFCWGLVGTIWLSSLALSAPTALHTAHLDLSAAGFRMAVCEEFWPGQERGRLLYSCFLLLFSYFLPLAAVSLSYCAISCHLRQRTTSDLLASHAQGRVTWGRRRRKTFILLLVSVLCFACSWLPLQVVNLIQDMDPDFSILGKRHVNLIQVCCHLVAMASACYNPFIYASLHSKFLSFLWRHFLPRVRGGAGGRSSLMASHRLPRLHTSSTLADTTVAGGHKIPQDSF